MFRIVAKSDIPAFRKYTAGSVEALHNIIDALLENGVVEFTVTRL